MHVHLRISTQAGETTDFKHAGPSIRIGRNSASELVFANGQEGVSWNHARIELTPERAFVLDIKSTNGTFVNNRSVQKADLQVGDRVRLGMNGPQLQVAGLDLSPSHTPVARAVEARAASPDFEDHPHARTVEQPAPRVARRKSPVREVMHSLSDLDVGRSFHLVVRLPRMQQLIIGGALTVAIGLAVLLAGLAWKTRSARQAAAEEARAEAPTPIVTAVPVAVDRNPPKTTLPDVKPPEVKPPDSSPPQPPPPEVKPGDENVALAQKVRDVLQTHCHRCHGGDPKQSQENEFDFILDPAKMLAEKKVLAANPEESLLTKRMRNKKRPMPPKDEKPRPSEAELALVDKWVLAGAPTWLTPDAKPMPGGLPPPPDLPPPSDGGQGKPPPPDLKSPSGDGEPGKSPTGGGELIAKQTFTILRTNCFRCHGDNPAKAGGGIDFILDRDKLVAHKKVVVGNPAQSRLIKLLQNGTMPPEKEQPRPSPGDIAVVEKWIQAGAPPPPLSEEPHRPFLDERHILAAIQRHLQNTNPIHYKFLRYFTLTHLHNNPRINAADLPLYRAALSKLLNSLSWGPKINVPQPLDDEGTVFVVDLRMLHWDKAGLWPVLLSYYPYGLRHDNDRDPEVAKLAAQVYQLAGTDLPYVRADWFIVTASQPPLYHDLLCLSEQLQDLEKLLGVDFQRNFQNDQLARAGFVQSGVSRQNRLVERHDSVFGAYWRSYDFKTNAGQGDLMRYPLGPLFLGHPFPETTFRAAGGEMVFHLPNGLQGYLLTDGQDRRINKGPVDVVRDSQETSGTPEIVNGLSCMACHYAGMVDVPPDQVSQGHGLGGAARTKITRLHPPPEEFKRLVDEDRSRFLAALEKATAAFLPFEPDKLSAQKEPVGLIARLHVAHELNLETVACELGMKDPQKLRVAVEASRELKKLGLGPLQAGAAIKREPWESREQGLTIFQRVAHTLDLGEPVITKKAVPTRPLQPYLPMPTTPRPPQKSYTPYRP